MQRSWLLHVIFCQNMSTACLADQEDLARQRRPVRAVLQLPLAVHAWFSRAARARERKNRWWGTKPNQKLCYSCLFLFTVSTSRPTKDEVILLQFHWSHQEPFTRLELLCRPGPWSVKHLAHCAGYLCVQCVKAELFIMHEMWYSTIDANFADYKRLTNGCVRNSVSGASFQLISVVKRSPKMMQNWHLFTDESKAKDLSFAEK